MQLQTVSSVDLYYICQMVDNVTRAPRDYLRYIEDIFGDTRSSALARKYPKFTCFHIFIEELISSVIWEERTREVSDLKKLWVHQLLKANRECFELARHSVPSHIKDAEDYISALSEDGILADLVEHVTMQVFHVLFANRGTLAAFGGMVSGYVQNTATMFSPEAFRKKGILNRGKPPEWAKSAVFHRDKGRCVICKSDLTRVLSQTEKIQYDHIVPLARGGMNCVTNLQLTCAKCNGSKGARSCSTSNEYEAWYAIEP